MYKRKSVIKMYELSNFQIFSTMAIFKRIKNLFHLYQPLDIYATHLTKRTLDDCMRNDRKQLNTKLDKFYANAHKKILSKAHLPMFETQMQRIMDLLSFVQSDISIINSKKFSTDDRIKIALFKQDLIAEIYIAFIYVLTTKNLGCDANLKTLYDYAVHIYTSY